MFIRPSTSQKRWALASRKRSPSCFRGRRPALEALENRRLLTISVLNADGEFNYETDVYSYAGVGFWLNPVAEIQGSVNGRLDNNPTDYQVKIDWGDGSSLDSNAALTLDPAPPGFVLVKGTHNYKTSGTYDVTTYATGPDGESASGSFTQAIVTPMPDAASIPPDLPNSYGGAQPLGDVDMSLATAVGSNPGNEFPIVAFAGVGFALNPVAQIQGYYNGQFDDTLSDYHAQINWGDGPSWDTNVGLTLASSTGYVLVKGSHDYQSRGTHDVTVYVTGPDGQTISDSTAWVDVTPMPDSASIPPEVPTSYTGSEPLGDVALGLESGTGGEIGSAYPIYALSGVGFAPNPVAEIQGYYNSQLDNTLSDYHAQINWGDGPSWDTHTTLVLDSTDGYVQIEGSHTYAAAGDYDVTVYITGPDGQTASATTSEVIVTTDAVSVTLSAPDVTDSNAASEVPYSFSLVFQNGSGLISGSSISGATVQVVAPNGETIPATLVSTALSGSTDGEGDASTITANYQIIPPDGDWNQSPLGTYTVNLGGSPVTGVSGGQAPSGSVGTFQVNVAVKLIVEVPQSDTTVPEDATIPVEVEAVGASGNPDPGENGPGTIQYNGIVVDNFSLQNGAASTTITAPNQSGRFELEASVNALGSAGTDVDVQPSESPVTEVFQKLVTGMAEGAKLVQELLLDDLKDPSETAQAALKGLEGVAQSLGVAAQALSFVPLAMDLRSLWSDATQPASPANKLQFEKDFSNADQAATALTVGWGLGIALAASPIGPVGSFVIGAGVGATVDGAFSTLLAPGAMTTAGQLYDALKGAGSSPLLSPGVSDNPGAGDPPPSIILVNPFNASSGAENLTLAGQAVYPQAGTPFSGAVATFLNASGNTNLGAYNAYIAWGDGNFTQGTVSALPGGGFEVTGSDTYSRAGIYSVTVVVTSTDGSAGVSYNGATVYPAGPTVSASAPVVSVLAPDISSENADWQTPYTFNVVYQDAAMVSLASLAGSMVHVQLPTGPAIAAQEIGEQILGSTDTLGDGSTIIATYQITPPAGNWYAAPPGTYTVNVSGSPITDLSGNPVAQGSVGTFQVSVPPTLDVSPAVGVEPGTGATVSNSASLALSGYAEASSTVEIYARAALVGSAQAGADGSWSFTYQAPQNGSYDFTAVATDSLGNTSEPSDDALVEVDAIAPTSTVAPLPAVTSGATFSVSWSGTDNAGGSGIALYNVYVSNDGGPFTVFQSNTVAISATFTGQTGHTYGFYSVATDYAGNVQAPPSSAQATTQLVLAPPTPAAPTLLPADSNGSPGGETTYLTSPYLTGTAPAGATVQLLNFTGAVLSSTRAGSAGAYELQVPGPLAVGSYPFRVDVVDQYGDISSPSAARTITVVNPPAPVVEKTTTTTSKNSIEAITVYFSEPMIASSAGNAKNYTLVDAGSTHIFGGNGNSSIQVKSVSYSSSNDSVKITLAKAVGTKDSLRLTINAQPPNGLRGVDGQFLHELANGKPGANAVIYLGAPAKTPPPPKPPKKTVPKAAPNHAGPTPQMVVQRRVVSAGQVAMSTAATRPVTAAIDALLEREELAGLMRSSRAPRSVHHASW